MGNVYVYNFGNCIDRCYVNFRLLFAYIVIILCHMLYFKHMTYEHKRLMLMPLVYGRCYSHMIIAMFFIYRADVMPIFGMVYIKRLMLLPFIIILADVIAMLPCMLQHQICKLQWCRLMLLPGGRW